MIDAQYIARDIDIQLGNWLREGSKGGRFIEWSGSYVSGNANFWIEAHATDSNSRGFLYGEVTIINRNVNKRYTGGLYRLRQIAAQAVEGA